MRVPDRELDDAINDTAEEIRAEYGYSRMGAHQIVNAMIDNLRKGGFVPIALDDLKRLVKIAMRGCEDEDQQFMEEMLAVGFGYDA